MKYKTSQLWMDYNSTDAEVRKRASKIWTQNCIRAEEDYQSVKTQLSKKFVSIYEKNERFHDWCVDKFEFLSSPKQAKDKFIIQLSHSSFNERIDKSVVLTFYGVDNVEMRIGKNGGFPLYQRDEYSYDEWERLNEKKIRYQLLMLSFSHISVVCSGVRVTRLRIV